MKMTANIIMECPSCHKIMIIANPLKQNTLSDAHRVEQRCGECKATLVMWIEMTLKMWQVKEEIK